MSNQLYRETIAQRVQCCAQRRVRAAFVVEAKLPLDLVQPFVSALYRGVENRNVAHDALQSCLTVSMRADAAWLIAPLHSSYAPAQGSELMQVNDRVDMSRRPFMAAGETG
jgi:hypothetical protein